MHPAKKKSFSRPMRRRSGKSSLVQPVVPLPLGLYAVWVFFSSISEGAAGGVAFSRADGELLQRLRRRTPERPEGPRAVGDGVAAPILGTHSLAGKRRPWLERVASGRSDIQVVVNNV